MRVYDTAKTYRTWERVSEPYRNENDKLVIDVKHTCDKCGGTGLIASRVENNQIVPISRDNGICYRCAGTGIVTKTVRWYNQRELIQMENAEIKREQEKENKAKAEFAKNKEAWLQANGFSAEGTYVLTGETYSIKDELRENGWKYNKVLMWHKADPTGYEDKAVFIPIDEIVTFSAWGKGNFKESATDYLKNVFHKDAEVAERSVWYEEDTLSCISATLTKKASYMGRYGLSYVYTFRDEEDHVFVWFTSKHILLDEGTKVELSGRVKDRKEYQGTFQTIVTRCTVK